jgi:3'5'-cyclic nucleotide phosphodiesterase
VAPNQVDSEELDVFLYHDDESDQNKKVASLLHDHTYGITSDPLTQFSCVLSALIHDVDHSGVPNAQLVSENAEIAQLYKNKSVAEQNSVDLAWNLLMSTNFTNLRRTIYETDDELKRFRQLVVNSVMATDIVDKTLKTLRNMRWDRAFSQTTQSTDTTLVTVNRKATIVIEHLIQASDVAHTMQHWHVYRKWNERFFLECYQAYRDGRAEKDPAEGWYEGEIGFFDFYIIPLAKKLKDCGVFGVSSDEYLNYAIRNRQEWETRGREVVNEMVEAVLAREGAHDLTVTRGSRDF